MGYSPYGRYIGSYNSLNPSNAQSYGEVSTGYVMSAGMLGATTNPHVANQVAEVMAKLNEGMKTIELTAEVGQGGVFETIPQEQFKEINRLAKLSGMTTTMHAPIIDPAGFERGQEGYVWTERAREDAEKQLLDSIRRVRDSNPNGDFNVTVHASSTPAIETKWVTEGGKQKEIAMKQYVVDVSSGGVGAVQRQELYRPQAGMEMRAYRPEDLIKKYNNDNWNNSMVDVMEAKRVVDTHYPLAEESEKAIQDQVKMQTEKFLEYKQKQMMPEAEEIQRAIQEKKMSEEDAASRFKEMKNELDEFGEKTFQSMYKNEISKRQDQIRGASHYYDGMQGKIEVMFHQFQKDLANREEELRRISDEEKKRDKLRDVNKIRGVLENISKSWEKNFPELEKLEKERKSDYLSDERRSKIDEDMLEIKGKLMNGTLREMDEMRRVSPQELIVPLEKFAKDKTVETFSNIAMKSYKEWGDKAPIISIENWEPNIAFSRADQLKDLINETREAFVEKAREEGISREKAEKAAERMIGATWDVAHINLLRKSGAPESEIIKETKIIAPYVKKMHIVDNFGYTDSHLPIGMGNVPIKKIMETMKDNEFAGPMISEAFPFAQHFKTSPHTYELEALGTPMNYPGEGGPSMSEARGMYGNAFTGYGNFLPEQHFAMYGGGFSGLPIELGGKVWGGKSSQFSGTPME